MKRESVMQAYIYPTIQLRNTDIHDSELDVWFRLSDDAAWLVRQLQHESNVGELVRRVARYRRTSSWAAQQALFALLGSLSQFGAVQIAWGGGASIGQQLHARLLWPMRYKSSVAGWVRATAQAYGLLTVLCMACMFVFSMAAGRVIIALYVLPLVLLGSCVVHELAHACMARLYGMPFALLSRFGYMAVMYQLPGRLRTARLIALAGPVAAFWLCIGCSLLTTETLRYVCWAAATLHLFTSAPWFSDGKTIWRIREKTST